MKICNIFTVKNQEQYKKEDFGMILAHLLEKGLYDKNNLYMCRHMIMDNGAYENSRVSGDISYLIQLVKKNQIIVDEIVIPDVIKDYKATKQLYENNYQKMFEYRDDYQFMYVVHAETIEQLREAIYMVNHERYLRLVLGVPKYSNLNRYSSEYLKELKNCCVPIHFLGIKDSFDELLPVKDIIRSCDSVQLSYISRDYSVQQKDLYKQKRNEPVIDLENDYINDTKIDMMRIVLNKELKNNGIL